jgi:DNA-binding winged helix-turn-helix (wHTH) protein/Flp pilus assembly protein TadD/TolB-like protein
MSPFPLRFADFELRPDSGELLKAGTPVKLQPQPARVLAILASRPGEVIEREEIRRLVWGDSFLDFDANLNFCIKQIRQALGDSATAPRFIETLPRRGYRFLMPVSQEEPRASVPPPPPRKTLWLPLLSVALLAGILVLLLGSRHAHSTTPRLVVLPFACRDQGYAEICGGITEVVTTELAKRFPKDLKVIASSSARVYAGKSGPELARGLDATHVLSGEAVVSGRQLRMVVRLASTAQEDLWRKEFETDLGDAPLLYSQIVRAVARDLRLPPPPSVHPPQRAKPSSEAYEAYLRGLYFLPRAQPEKAVSSLQEAVLLDPTFAQAYATLARAIDSVEKPLCADRPLIDAAARRALALDPNLAEAHLAWAHSLFHCHFDWQEAGREFQRAIALNPGNAETYSRHAFYLASLGRHDDAIDAVRQARELDPASMLLVSDFAYFFYVGRRYDEAVREARKALELMSISPEDPGVVRFYHFWTLWVLFRSALAMEDEAMAVEAGRDLMELYGEGQAATRVRSLKDFLEWQETWLQKRVRTQPVPAYFFAIAAMDSGHRDRALDALEKDCQTRRSYMLLFTAAEPAFDPLRGDPRFERILDCIRLPADAPARAPRPGG